LLGACFETYEPFISLMDTELGDTGAQLYFNSKSFCPETGNFKFLVAA
jgi:hypothetical protein